MQKNSRVSMMSGSVMILLCLILTTFGTLLWALALSHVGNYVMLKKFLEKKEEHALLQSTEQIIQEVIRTNLEGNFQSSEENLKAQIDEKLKLLSKKNSAYEVKIKNKKVKLTITSLLPKALQENNSEIKSLDLRRLELPLSLQEWNNLEKVQLPGILDIEVCLKCISEDKEFYFPLRVKYFAVPIINYPIMQYGLFSDTPTISEDGSVSFKVTYSLEAKLLERIVSQSTNKTYTYDPNFFSNCFRHDIAMRGNLFRGIFREDYEPNADKTLFDFSKQATDSNNYVIPEGVEYDPKKKKLSIDLNHIATNVVYVYDSVGDSSIDLMGSQNRDPKYIFIKNKAKDPTNVVYSCKEAGPIMLQMEHCILKTDDVFNGALILDSKSNIKERFSYKGHMSLHMNSAILTDCRNTKDYLAPLVDFSPIAILVTSEWME